MFIRVQSVSRAGRQYRYLKVLASSWQEGRPVQRTVLNFGSVDHWPRERLEELVRKLSAFIQLDLVALSAVRLTDCRCLGPYLPLAALWDRLGLDALVAAALAGQPLSLPVAAYAKALVLTRLVRPSSKKALWEALGADTLVPGVDPDALPLHGYYRALEYLVGAKGTLEKALHRRLSHLFNRDVSLVFWDLTSTYFEGGGCPMARHGYSRDHRPDLVQIEIGLLVDGDGIPIAHEVFDGNIKDVATVLPVLERLQRDFGLRRCIFVGDDGMASAENLQRIAAAGYEYITSLALRRSQAGTRVVAGLPPRSDFREVSPTLRLGPERVEGVIRYLPTWNPERAASARRHRKERLRKCVAELRRLQEPRKPRARQRTPEQRLAQAAGFLKAKGCAGFFQLRLAPAAAQACAAGAERLPERVSERARSLRQEAGAFRLSGRGLSDRPPVGEPGLHWQLDRQALRSEQRLDGLLVLETNSQELEAAEVAAGYRSLWRVEAAFRGLKDTIRLRPIRHWTDQRVRGHVFVCVLAFMLERLYDRALEAAGLDLSAQAALRQLETIQAVTLEAEGQSLRRRTEITPSQQRLLAAVQVGQVPELW